MKILGLCGYAKVGKDTAAHGMPDWYRAAFADSLKEDLQPLFRRIGINLSNPKQKEMARPMLVEWGRLGRAIRPDFWIERLFERIQIWQTLFPERATIVTDVRYLNEVKAIEERGGIIYYVIRPGFQGANEEETRSIAEILKERPNIPNIVNCGTPEELGAKLLKVVYEEKPEWRFTRRMD